MKIYIRKENTQMKLQIINGILKQVKSENGAADNRIILPPEITEIGPGAFHECRDIEGVVLPHNLKKISEGAFSYCHNLAEIVIPQGVTEILDGAFAYSGLENVVISNSVEIIGKKAFTNSKLRSVKIPDSVKRIDYGAFSYCGTLHSIEIGAGLQEIGCKVFFGCVSLNAVYIPDSVRYIDQDAFLYSSKIVFYVKNGSFAHSFALQNGYRTQENTGNHDQIDEELLNQCLVRNNLQSLVFQMVEHSVSVLDELPVHFYCLVEKESVYRIHANGLNIPSLFVNHISDSSWTDGYFFTEKRIINSDTSRVRIKISLRHNPNYVNETTGKKQVRVLNFKDNFLFLDAVHVYPDQCYFLDPYVCTESDLEYGMLQLSGRNRWDNICHLVIPDGFTKINDCACSGANNLESVHVGNTIIYIGNDSFSYCPKLSNVYIGEAVEASHTRAFNNCPNLQTVTMSYRLKEIVMQKKAMCRQSAWPWFQNCPLLEKVYFDDGTSILL